MAVPNTKATVSEENSIEIEASSHSVSLKTGPLGSVSPKVAQEHCVSPISPSLNNSNVFSPSPSRTFIKGKESPSKLRTLAPKSLFTEKADNQYVPLPKISKKKANHSDQKPGVRPILPKNLVFGPKSSSPTKTAALLLKKKATLVCQRMSPVKILPMYPCLDDAPLVPSFPKMTTRSQVKMDSMSQSTQSCKTNQTETTVVNDSKKKPVQIENTVVSDEAVLSQEEDVEEVENDDQIHLDDLMAACTTIRYDPKKGTTNQDFDTKSKTQKRRHLCMSMLEEDILDCDMKKDERDVAYARNYFLRVKDALRNDTDRFRQFLDMLHVFSKDNGDPVKLYADISSLLADHQDLVEDFAGFLLAHQAVECGCFVSHQQYHQAREFLRKLEIYCDNTNTFQRTLKVLSKFETGLNQEVSVDSASYKERILTVLKNVPDILDDMLNFYLDGPVPESHTDDFEELDMEATERNNDFEEVILPPGRETYNTRLCTCSCHQNTSDGRFLRRLQHCFSCSLMLHNGMLVLKTTRHDYRPVTVIYPHKEEEKLKEAKREAAQLALAKAKAQKAKAQKQKPGGKKGRNKRKLSLKDKKKKGLSKQASKRRKSASCSDIGTNETKAMPLNKGQGTSNSSQSIEMSKVLINKELSRIPTVGDKVSEHMHFHQPDQQASAPTKNKILETMLCANAGGGTKVDHLLTSSQSASDSSTRIDITSTSSLPVSSSSHSSISCPSSSSTSLVNAPSQSITQPAMVVPPIKIKLTPNLTSGDYYIEEEDIAAGQ